MSHNIHSYLLLQKKCVFELLRNCRRILNQNKMNYFNLTYK